VWKRGGHITVHQVSEVGTQEMYKKYKAVYIKFRIHLCVVDV